MATQSEKEQVIRTIDYDADDGFDYVKQKKRKLFSSSSSSSGSNSSSSR